MSTQSQRSFERSVEQQSTDSFEPLPKDQIFHLLQTQRRRDALRYLKHHDNPVEMRALAEQVAAWENDTTVAELTSAERQRVYIALYQSHLPKLDEEGIIEYNQSRGIVERAERASQFDPYLEKFPGEETHSEQAQTEQTESLVEMAAETESDATANDVPWLSYYRRTTLASVLLLTASQLNVFPVSMLSNHIWGAVIVSIFALLSLGQLAYTIVTSE